jgi:hypothetical protein
MIKKRIALLIGVLVFLTGCSSQPANHIQVVDEPSTQRITEPVVMTEVSEVQPIAQEVVRELASDQFTGRLVGTEGNQLAAEYLAEEFETYRLLPWNEEEYLQPYTQEVANPEEQEPQVSIVMKDGSILDLVFGTDYICSIVEDDVDLEIPIELYPEVSGDYQGACIVVSEKGKMMGIPSTALMVVDNTFHFAPGTGYTSVTGRQIDLVTTEDIYEKMQTQEAKLVRIHAKSNCHEEQVNNVVAKLPGKKNTDKVVVLTAHFDMCGKQGDTIYHGALDNASGVAAMIDVARYLQAYTIDKEFDFDIIVAGVNSEELYLESTMGRAGSRVLADQISTEYNQVYNINFDCVGGRNSGALYLGTSDELSKVLSNRLKAKFDEVGIKYTDDLYAPLADHASFLDHHAAAITIGQGDLSPYIHIPTDTYEKINYQEIDTIANAVTDMIIQDGEELFGELARKEENMKGPDNIQWCEEAKEELIRRLDGRVLAFDEAYTFLYDGIRTTGTGYHPFNNLSEAHKYYPNLVIQEVINDFSISKIDIDNSKQIGRIYWSIGDNLDRVPLEQINKIRILEDEITDIKVEYYNSDRDEYLSFSLYPNGMKGSMKVDPVDGMKDVYLLKSEWREDDEYEGFIYKKQGWTAEVKTYSKWYDESSDDYWPDWNTMQKPEDEVLNLIETIQIDEIADPLILMMVADE